jgi:hypothetical protein
MKSLLLFLGIFSLTTLFSCVERDKSLKASTKIIDESNTTNNKTLEIVNDCMNQTYNATLSEYINLDSNAFELTISFKNGQKKLHTLDLPTGRTKIEKCSEGYVLLSSACGGSCYGLDFVFLDSKRNPESYMYSHVATSNEYIISHIENEEFEKLKIRNLQNNKEMTLDISNCEDLNSYPCDIISLTAVKDILTLEFDSSSNTPKRKSISIYSIL